MKSKRKLCVAIKTYMIYFIYFFYIWFFFILIYLVINLWFIVLCVVFFFLIFPRRDETMKSNKMRNEKQYTNGTKKSKQQQNF